ncbi:MAG: CysB family HTH-type transcriptional regulator [Proteobacteria bacterium]|nr:CysB family HTH-type transcriptional regulator [Pseudomonadota bacterium]
MNFQQLKIVRETVRRGYNLTEVANALYTSQPGVSKNIKDLEDELGVELFVRRGKRLLGLTEPGKELLETVERILRDAQNLRNIADQFASREQGSLTVATTHTQARYALPEVIKQFKARYPQVHLALHQCSPREIVEMLLAGEADIGIATEAIEGVAELVSFPCYSWHHAVIVPQGHALTQLPALTLDAIAAYPIVTYHEGFTGRAHIDKAFAAAGQAVDIVLSAIDADVIKTYVEIGLGIGIVAPMAFNPAKDTGLALLAADHLFDDNTTRLAVHRGVYLRDYARQFVTMVAPGVDEKVLQKALNGGE